MPKTEEFRERVSTLERSHETLESAIAGLSAHDLSGPSYCSEWSIAQVLSHLGSGAEIFKRFGEAGSSGAEPPARDSFPAVWDEWNRKDPEQQAADCLEADRSFIDFFKSWSEAQIETFELSFFGMDTDAPRFVSLRLSEHVLHTWDIVVMREQDATLPTAAARVLLGTIDSVAGRIGKAVEGPMQIHVETTDPERSFLLSVDEGVALDPDAGAAGRDAASARLELPSESFVRLVVGRLDPAHTPSSVSADGVDLDDLRAVFPGF